MKADVGSAEDWDYLNQGNMHVVFRSKNHKRVLKFTKRVSNVDEYAAETERVQTFEKNFEEEIRKNPLTKDCVAQVEIAVLPKDRKDQQDFIDALYDKAKSGMDHSSKYNLTEWTLSTEPAPTIEENLVINKFEGLKSVPSDHRMFHFEVKTKSALSVIPATQGKEFFDRFLPSDPEETRSKNLEWLQSVASKIQGNERHQFFLRDVQREDGKKDPCSFSGDKFFSSNLFEREEAIRPMLEVDSNYLRLFDQEGTRLSLKEFKETFKDLETDLLRLIARSLDERILRFIHAVQTILGESIGDLVVKLEQSGYYDVLKNNDPDFLLIHSEDVAASIIDLSAEIAQHSEESMTEQVTNEERYAKLKTAVIRRIALHSSENPLSHNLDLSIYYVTLLTAMTFCDCSVICKVLISSEPLALNDSSDKRVQIGSLLRQEYDEQGESVDNTTYFASKSTLIDIGAKKHSNLQRLLKTFEGFGKYFSYVQSKYSSPADLKSNHSEGKEATRSEEVKTEPETPKETQTTQDEQADVNEKEPGPETPKEIQNIEGKQDQPVLTSNNQPSEVVQSEEKPTGQPA